MLKMIDLSLAEPRVVGMLRWIGVREEYVPERRGGRSTNENVNFAFKPFRLFAVRPDEVVHFLVQGT